MNTVGKPMIACRNRHFSLNQTKYIRVLRQARKEVEVLLLLFSKFLYKVTDILLTLGIRSL
ncbi:MAG: hypothetical protein V3U62_02640 [Sedimenticolaceae bacterium]